MGRRSASDTVAQILRAFLDEPTWRQDALARHVGVTSRTIRQRLDEMSASGFRFERQEEAPHVFWSVPQGWLAGAVTFTEDAVPELLKLLLRVPRGETRDRIVGKLIGAIPRARRPGALEEAVAMPSTTEREERFLSILFDARMKREALSVLYQSLRRSDAEWRHLSVQQVIPGPPIRVAAWCHRRDELRWFRGDRIVDAVVDPRVVWRSADAATVRGFVEGSVHGYRDRTDVRSVFRVSDPDARWVRGNLPDAITGRYDVVEIAAGIRVSVRAAVAPVARYVAGLGGAGLAETPELAAEVERIARGALHEGVGGEGA